MSLPWFRFYHEVKDDPKMGALPDGEFRVFVEGMCWACEEDDFGSTGLKIESVNWAFRRNVTETFQALLQKKLFTLRRDGKICITNWMKRQIPSDSSTRRVRKYREKLNVTLHETLQKRSCNVRDLEERRGEKNIKLTTKGEKALSKKFRPTAKRFEDCLNSQWVNDAGKWVNRIKSNLEKSERVVAEIESAIKESRIKTTPAQYAEQIWKEFR
jgi:hypothetical protein